MKAQLLGPPVMELRLPNGSNGRGSAPVAVGKNGLRTARDLLARFFEIEAVGDDWLRYRTPTPAINNPELIRALSEAGVPVVTLSEVPQSLERVYLEVMGEGASCG